MKRGIMLLFSAFFLIWPGMGHSHAASESDMDDQISVEVTVYNTNIGLVREVRELKLPEGEGKLTYTGISSHVIPATVHAKSLNAPDAFVVLEQNYAHGLIDGKTLLDRYVGKKIKIIDWNEYQDRKEVVEALLVSNNNEQIYQINGDIYLGHPGYMVLPAVPEDLFSKPTLTWLYQNQQKKTHKLEVSYLTRNISWNADYVLILGQESKTADLAGWVTLDNRSGTVYRNARLKLVAGRVHLVEERPQPRAYAMDAAVQAKASQFKEKAFSEYHAYDLKRRSTIKDQEAKQIGFIESTKVSVRKKLEVHGTANSFMHPHREKDPGKPVKVFIEFENAEENQIAMPLPAGVMRLYEQGGNGHSQFMGEDRIGHTAKGETVKIEVGTAFDVVAERIQTDYKKISSKLHESEWEITLRNSKKDDVEVAAVESLTGNWRIIHAGSPYKKLDAFTIKFDVKVPGEGEVKVQYRVQVGL